MPIPLSSLFWVALCVTAFLLSGQSALAQAVPPQPVVSSFAAIPPGKNVAEVAVNGRSAEEENAAHAIGLRIVLLRYSNRNNPLAQDAVRKAAEDARAYVRDQYYRRPSGSDKITRQTPLTPRVRQTSEATHLLSIRYSLDAINQFIASQLDEETLPEDAAAPTNTALVWLLVEDGNRTLIVGGGTGRNVIDRAREIGGGVGQQLLFPSMDAQDQQALSAQDIRDGNQQKIIAASARYREPVVLTGILSRSRGRSWNTNWSRYHNGEIRDKADEASTLDQALQQGIRWLAGDVTPAAGIGVNRGTSASNEGLIWISDVTDTGGYARLMAMIDGVEGAFVYLKGLSAESLQVAVSPRSAVGNVAQAMVNTNRLRSAAAVPTTGGQRPDVFLQYIP